MNWIEETAGLNERRARIEPMPNGPYFFVHQHKEEYFLADPNGMSSVTEFQTKFELHFGYATYAVSLGKPQKVGYWYDCSD
jgi:hypothetical protein